MPLGASITAGDFSSDSNGYRQDLRTLLTNDGYAVDMVGSRQSGNMEDNDNEGWSGLRIEQIEEKAKLSVPNLQPSIFTINAGTNDCVQNFNVDTLGSRMDELIEYLFSTASGSTIILSTLIINLNTDTEARVEQANAQITDLAAQKQADGKRIVLADMHGADGPQPEDMANDTHPNDVGYDKMAEIWHRAIADAISRDFVQEPL